MSDTEEDIQSASIPIQFGQRRVQPADQRGTGRRNKQARPMIGGDVVGSMKRGIKDHSGDVHRREARLRVLYSIAGAMFCVLTAIWVKRLYNHWSIYSAA